MYSEISKDLEEEQVLEGKKICSPVLISLCLCFSDVSPQLGGYASLESREMPGLEMEYGDPYIDIEL